MFRLKIYLAIITLLAASAPTVAQTTKIGVSLPLSGNAAALGKQFIAGARLAMRLLPAARNYELVISDDGCDEKLAELAIKDIQDEGAQIITGFLCNEPVYAAANLLRNADIPIIVAGARGNRILKDRSRNSWNVWQMAPRDADASQSAFEILSKRWQSTPYAIVDDGTVFGRTQADEFRALMEEAGLKPQFVDNFRPSQSTQAGLIRRLKKSGVEAIYLAAGDDDVALIGRNMIEFDFSAEIATGEGVMVLPFIDDNQGIPVGMLAIMPPPPEDIQAVQFMTKTVEASKLEPEPYMFLGYATLQMVVQYLESGSKELAERKFNTILGTVEFDENGRNITQQYNLYRWDGSNFVKQPTNATPSENG